MPSIADFLNLVKGLETTAMIQDALEEYLPFAMEAINEADAEMAADFPSEPDIVNNPIPDHVYIAPVPGIDLAFDLRATAETIYESLSVLTGNVKSFLDQLLAIPIVAAVPVVYNKMITWLDGIQIPGSVNGNYVGIVFKCTCLGQNSDPPGLINYVEETCVAYGTNDIISYNNLMYSETELTFYIDAINEGQPGDWWLWRCVAPGTSWTPNKFISVYDTLRISAKIYAWVKVYQLLKRFGVFSAAWKFVVKTLKLPLALYNRWNAKRRNDKQVQALTQSVASLMENNATSSDLSTLETLVIDELSEVASEVSKKISALGGKLGVAFML